MLRRLGVAGWQFQVPSMLSILGCASFWLRAKTVDQAAHGHAERRALYIGLWTPTLCLVGRTLDERRGT